MSQGISKASMVSGGVLKDLILLSLTLCKSRQFRGLIPLFYKCFLKKNKFVDLSQVEKNQWFLIKG